LAKVRRAVGPDLISGRAALTFAPQDAQLDVQQVAEGIERAERAVAAKDPLTALDAASHAADSRAAPPAGLDKGPGSRRGTRASPSTSGASGASAS
jgi:hypothetical protein